MKKFRFYKAERRILYYVQYGRLQGFSAEISGDFYTLNLPKDFLVIKMQEISDLYKKQSEKISLFFFTRNTNSLTIHCEDEKFAQHIEQWLQENKQKLS